MNSTTEPTSAVVVIATRNRCRLLARSLERLMEQTYRAFEIVVIDDASTDGTPELLAELRERPLRIHGIRLKHRAGPAGARNRGVAFSTGPFVAFTDDDCEPEPRWLESLVFCLSSRPPQVAGVGGRVLPANSGLISDYMTHHRILEPPASLNYLVTANCMYRRDALRAVSGFDERVKSPGGEDPGLAFALRRQGYRFEFCPDAVVRHHYRESILDFMKTFYRYGRGCRVVLG